MRKKWEKAFRASLPVLVGYVVLGIGFGIVLDSHGFGILWSFAMSAFIYAGSMEYAAINLITGGASLITAAITTVAVNARHLFYGISMVDRYKSVKKKPFLIFTLTDETYSLVCSGEADDDFFFQVSLLDYFYWVFGSVLGSVIGTLLPFEIVGIDFALTALFITVFVEQWLSTKDHFAAVTGVGASVLCLLVFGADSFLIPAMLLITLVLSCKWWGRDKNA